MKKLHTTTYKCIIRHFADGDTCLVFHECDHCFSWQSSYLRIRGIESEELRGPEASRAKAIALQLTEQFRYLSGELYLTKSGTDKYGRYIGDIMIDGIFLSQRLVDLGVAWYIDAKNHFKKKV